MLRRKSNRGSNSRRKGIEMLSLRTYKVVIAMAAMIALGGCMQNDAQRGVVGAAAGGALAGVAGGDVVTGALIGGAAGVVCRDMNVSGCRNN